VLHLQQDTARHHSYESENNCKNAMQTEDIQEDDSSQEIYVTKFEIQYDEDEKGKRRATIRLSNATTVEMRELDGGDFRKVRKLSGRDAHMLSDNLALYALISINGKKLIDVANEMHLQSRAEKFPSLQEYGELPQAYDQAFQPLNDSPKASARLETT
jgi:hypothetical protein